MASNPGHVANPDDSPRHSDSSFVDVKDAADTSAGQPGNRPVPLGEYTNFTAAPVDEQHTKIVTVKPAIDPIDDPRSSNTKQPVSTSPVHDSAPDKAETMEADADHLAPLGVNRGSAVQDNDTTITNVPANEAVPAVVPNERKVHLMNDDMDTEEPEVHNVGWNQQPAVPVVTSVANDELWMLVRRFNLQMYHVKAIPPLPGGRLDLNTSMGEEFSPDKLRANLERLYMTVIVGGMGAAKHIARIRSWHERKRTIAFCVAYFLAWTLNLVMPAILTLFLVLILYPRSRRVLFPPVPLAVVNASTGGLQTPASGTLGSQDSLTGAPEAHKGQAVEQEASNFVTGFASVAVGAAVGKAPTEPGNVDAARSPTEAEDGKGEPGANVPDPAGAVVGASGARTSASGAAQGENDKTREPMQEKIWEKARPVMRGVAGVADTWERFGNALSPTPPFPRDLPRLKMASLVAGPLLLSLALPVAWLFRGVTLILGIVFFSDPLMMRGWHWLNANYPNWQDALALENSILYGVPTNAQLTLTLLRLGEAHKTPLPPPPLPDAKLPNAPKARQIKRDLPVDASPDDIAANSLTPASSKSEETPKKKKPGSKILSILKGTARVGVTTIMGVDRVKATAGSESALDRLGVLHPHARRKPPDGPSEFVSRYEGKKGIITISTTATSPCVSYERHTLANPTEPAAPLWSIALNRIAGLKKVGGTGFKTRLLVGWGLGMEIVDGLIIEDDQGRSYHLTALPRRDELFNRLIALGGQHWECQ